MNLSDYIIPKFLEICPDFKKQWDEHIEFWNGEPAGSYNDMAEFARFVVDLYEKNETNNFSAIFDQIEKFLSEDNVEL